MDILGRSGSQDWLSNGGDGPYERNERGEELHLDAVVVGGLCRTSVSLLVIDGRVVEVVE